LLTARVRVGRTAVLSWSLEQERCGDSRYERLGNVERVAAGIGMVGAVTAPAAARMVGRSNGRSPKDARD